jgi:hypothetical protein
MQIALCDGGEYFKNFVCFLLSSRGEPSIIHPLAFWVESGKIPDLVVFSHFGEQYKVLENWHRKNPKLRTIFISGEPLHLPVFSPHCTPDILVDTKRSPHTRESLSKSCSVFYVPFALVHFWERWVWKPSDLAHISASNLNPGKREQIKIDVLKSASVTEKRFCAFLYSRAISFRNQFFHALSRYKHVDDLGSQPNGKTCSEKKELLKEENNYYDTAVKLYSKYKFVICFENCIMPGYVTEKLVNALLLPNVVPIYYGAPDVGQIFNSKRFINLADFESIETCVEFIAKIDQDDSLFQEFCRQPCLLVSPEKWIRFYLDPVQTALFSSLQLPDKRTPLVTFLSFGSKKWESAVIRICKQAQESGIFDVVFKETEESLFANPDFGTHADFVRQNRNKGFGFWIWKSFLVRKALQGLRIGDILVYCDSGCQLRLDPRRHLQARKRFFEYLKMINSSTTCPSGVLCFELRDDKHTDYAWTKMDAFHSVLKNHPDKIKEFGNIRQRVGGILLIRKCDKSQTLVDCWYEVCSDQQVLNDNPSKSENHPSFIEHRRDQSCFSLLSKLHHATVLPDETYWDPEWETTGQSYPVWATRTST